MAFYIVRYSEPFFGASQKILGIFPDEESAEQAILDIQEMRNKIYVSIDRAMFQVAGPYYLGELH